MVVYVLFSALVNIALGFAIAVYLGWRYRELLAAESDPGWLPPDAGPSANGLARDGSPSPPAPAESRDAPSASPPPETPPLDPQTQAMLEELRQQVLRYEEQLTTVDDQLRSGEAARDAAGVRACVGALDEANETQGQACAQARQRLSQREPDAAWCESILRNIETLIDSQAAQIQSSGEALETVGRQGDWQADRRRLLEETARLADANDKVRDALDEAGAVLAAGQQRPAAPEPETPTDGLTGMASRAGLEAGLAAWWENDTHRVRRLCVAMVDVDQFGLVNERHGRKLGDRVLRALAQLLSTEGRGDHIIARFSGQRFLVLFPDADLPTAVQFVERIRQTVESSHLQYQEQDIRITVSCAVTEATSADTSETLFGRAEATLLEAKRYGRNRTFIHEGKYPAPVAPPHLGLEERFLAL